MSYRRILVAVDDSPASLDAARAAVALAAVHGSAVRAITVTRSPIPEQVSGHDRARTVERLEAGGRSVLAWVADLSSAQGVECDTVLRSGDPFRQVLAEADRWDADLIVMGRSDRRGPSSPYLGSETAHVLEFTDRPVLVVPQPERTP